MQQQAHHRTNPPSPHASSQSDLTSRSRLTSRIDNGLGNFTSSSFDLHRTVYLSSKQASSPAPPQRGSMRVQGHSVRCSGLRANHKHTCLSSPIPQSCYSLEHLPSSCALSSFKCLLRWLFARLPMSLSGVSVATSFIVFASEFR
jgi:hypothetical protein